uniref:Solute carrier family 22 member 7b, tandem duplicate 3 n=1 Tax=Sander lucioperca TaxID=283035 RepID=A0A8C9ZHV6_SANLU
MFCVLRFFTGFCITGIIIVSTVLKEKKCFLVFSQNFDPCKVMRCLFSAGVEWVDIDVSSPLTLAIITWRWMPESARWLIANGKLEQAQKYLKICAKINRTEEFIHTLKTEVNRPYSYLDLIRTAKMRKLALCTGIVWFCVATAFYGISFNITGFGLNIYLTQFTYAFIELPAKVSVYYLLDKIGRRGTEVGALLMVAISQSLILFSDMSVVRTVVAVIGKGFSSASFATLVLYSSELYPTVVRQNGMGYNSFMARTGVAVAPLILLLDEVWKDLPQVVLCSVAVLGGVVARTLSETRNRCLPETIEDIEQQNKASTNLYDSAIPLRKVNHI